jgi:Carboxypeptidase regulatory-like domain
MRSFGVRLPILAATAWAGIGLSALGRDLGYSETLYLAPTVATYALPTSYVTSDTYVVPTSYSFPTYLPAAYVADPVTVASTSYLTTAYQVRRGLFGRLRLVERPVLASYPTSYFRTSYFVPTYYTSSYRATGYTPTTYSATVFDYPRVWPSSYSRSIAADCDPVPCDTPMLASGYRSSTTTYPAESAAAPTYTVPRSNGGSRAASGDVSNDPTIPSTVYPQSGEPEVLNPVDDAAAKKATPAENRADSPPKPPLPEREKSTAAPLQGEKGGGTQTPAKTTPAPGTGKPVAPSGDPVEPDIKPAPIDNNAANRHESLKPIYSTVRTLRPELRNVLLGRVESDAGEPLGEVAISVARADNTSIRRTGMTNAFGNFAIRLTDGEWNVNVRMPSGRLHTVRTVTVNNGKVMDNQEGREVRNLIISY